MTTLAELRQASLKEQKQKEQNQHSHESAPATASMSDLAAAGQAASSHDAASIPAVKECQSTPESLAAPASAFEPAVSEVEAPLPAISPEAARAEEFFARIHDALAHKTLHQSGAKVSADMPSALFHRAKRYCLDHGNITLRQMLIDLLTTYLEEEGY